MKILKIDEFMSSNRNSFFVCEIQDNKNVYILLSPFELEMDGIKMSKSFNTFNDAFEFADELKNKLVNNRNIYVELAIAYEFMDEVSELVKIKLDKLFRNGYYAFDPYKEGKINTIKNPIYTRYGAYTDIANNLSEYANKKRVFYFNGKPFTGEAKYINGDNGYTKTDDHGYLCALVDDSLWTNGNPNILVDNNGKSVCDLEIYKPTVRYKFKNGVFQPKKIGTFDDKLAEHLEELVKQNEQWVDMGGSVLWKNKNERLRPYNIYDERIKRIESELPTENDCDELMETCDIVKGKFNNEDGLYFYNKAMDKAIFFPVEWDYKYDAFNHYVLSTKNERGQYRSFAVNKCGECDCGNYGIGGDDHTVCRIVKRK